MSDCEQIPASEVLKEAAEYLCKLGANLRLRSESLKDKRISKDKLKNSHAILKTVDKILLICQLSKKSLDNVENGVKKVMNAFSRNQPSSKREKARVAAETKEYSKHYIQYGSCKLRINSKINFKHFKSAKVRIRKLTLLEMLKYPIHYDCKLKSMQQKKSDYESKTTDKIINRTNDKVAVKESTPELSEELSKTRKISSNGSDDENRKLNIDNSKSKTSYEKEKKMSNKDKPRPPSKKSIDSDTVEPSKTRRESSGGSDSENNSKTKSKTDNEKEKKIRNKDKPRPLSKKSRDSDTEVPSKTNQVSSDRSDSENSKDSKTKRKTGNEKGKNKDRPIPLYKKSRDSDADSSNNTKQASKKYKEVKIFDSSSDDEKQANKRSKEHDVGTTESASKDNDTKTGHHSSDSDPGKSSNKDIAAELEDDGSNSNAKLPVLKCVDITTLLNSPDKGKTKPKKVQFKFEVIDISQYEYEKEKEKKIEEDERYLEQKRQEVLKFKAKEFSINICKLPEFSEEYLREHKLNRIIHCSVVLVSLNKRSVSISDESNASGSNNPNIPKKLKLDEKVVNDEFSDTEISSPNVIDKAKAALLNISSSEDESVSSAKKNAEDTKLVTNLLNKKDKESNIGSSSDSESKTMSKNKTSKKSIDKKIASDSLSENVQKTKSRSNKEIKSNDHKHKKGTIYSSSDDEAQTQLENKESKEYSDKEIKSDSLSENELKSKSSQLKNSSASEAIDKNNSSPINNNDDISEETPSNRLTNSDNEESTTTKDDTNKNFTEAKTQDSNKISDNEKKSTNPAETTPTKKSGNSSTQSTPQSKRKQMMETMEAKRMLLTDSSSDDNEKQKESMDAIKKTLLWKPDDSDSDNPKEPNKRKLSSSSSEDDIISKVKRRRKKFKRDSRRSRGSRDKDSTKHSDDGSSSAEKSRKMGRTRVKTSSSHGQNTDAQDSDKSIEGLTKLDTLHKISSRNKKVTASTSESESKNGGRRSQRNRFIKTDHMLEAESKSESSAEEIEDNIDDDELPPVQLSLNGDSAMEKLAKTELLEQSNESSSEHESSNENDDEEEKNENGSDEDFEENVRTKRRKAALVSSDSDGGAKKEKLSDFEDSEVDSSEPVKRKRKKKSEDSDASVGSSTSDDGKKKRRRIKQVKDSDASGSESETEGKKHGRKNIRKVMGKDQLEEATKKAAREEKERIARISERQKLYNNLEFDESGKPDEVILDKVVLDFDPDTKEPLIEVDRGLVKKLKPHQANGIKFMWNACFESVKRIKKDRGSGCILAHCMGLGKTLQVVSLTHTLLTHSKLTKVKRVLVVCPLSTVLNWVNEFNMWLKHAHNDTEIDIYELSRYKQNSERAFQLQQWLDGGGVCVLGYEMFRNLSADNTKKFRKKMLKSFQESLVDPGPDLVVCDEGHLLKNEKTSLSQSMNRVSTLRRIVLTGTPLQNNLKEYYCMVQFVKPNLLGKYNEYLNRFVNPITNGQYTDSTEHDIKIMKRRSHVLHKMLDGSVQRRDYGVLAPFLPPKHEYVLFITLSEVQVKLYQFYLDNYSRRPTAGKSSGFLFPDFQSLQRIWTHPLVLKYNSERYEIMQQKKREREEEDDSEGSLVNFIDDDSTPDETSTDESSDDLSDLSDDSHKKNKKKKNSKKKGRETKATTRRATRANPNEAEELIELKDNPDIEQVRNENPTEWWIKLVTDDELEDMRHSSKLVLLFDILRQCEAIGDKLLVFSQSLYSLDLIEHFLGKVDEATQEGRVDEKLCGHVGSWSPGVDYFRLDGSTSCENRSIWCKNFNKEDNPRARLFLISTRAGGLGINLVAANRVVIFDVSWNPSHDVQSIFRVYRFGQKKPCYVYRFLAMGTMEEKIYERQVTKQAISKRVIDEQQIDRHYAENDLAELYKFEPTPPSPRPLPPLPKDRLFAEMLKEHDQQIYKYHEHDSLLENKEEETLSEEERKAAWEDFENEKNKPPPVPFNNMWGANGMAGLMAQQQQMAYAALATMLRKDMPNISEEQIRNMLPLIYNANPAMYGGYDFGLMQKMNDIYKYTQPGGGMMNPGMMNPMMNAAAAGGGSGSSGLQYEPPWQRHHQIQQQQRLQQLMQHQGMGAKYYAGGLGSRDPVAMAQQQQLARQMLLSEGPHRARGRPPLQPQVQDAQADIVNLDSD